MPFGYPLDPADFPPSWQSSLENVPPIEFAHGFSSHHYWQFDRISENEIVMLCQYPEDNNILKLVRRILPDPNAPALDFELEIHARRDCHEPVALHACFALPPISGQAVLLPGAFRIGRTHPGRVEASAPIFEADCTFTSLGAVPADLGGEIDARLLPFAFKGEELLQLDDIDGTFELELPESKAAVLLNWDANILPSVLLWFSNGGRSFAPWNNRHYCIGIEPCASPFGLHPDTARRDNPIHQEGTPTTVALSQDRPTVVRYRVEVAER